MIQNTGFSSIEVSQGTKKEKNKGVAAGLLIGAATLPGHNPMNIVPSKLIMPKMQNASVIDEDSFKKVSQAVGEALENTGLSKKGVEIIKVLEDGSNASEVGEIFRNGVLNSKKGKFLLKNMTEDARKAALDPKVNMIVSSLKNGVNAFFDTNTNKILLPEKKMALAAFHEMGHAINHNFGKIGKILQKVRPLAMIAPLGVALIALTSKKKANSEPNENDPKGGKFRQFVKNNVGKLAFLGFSPVIIEEAMATVKGNKLAKGLLSPELFKKVRTSNALGLASYIAAGVLTGIGAMLAIKAKDKIQANYEEKQAAKL